MQRTDPQSASPLDAPAGRPSGPVSAADQPTHVSDGRGPHEAPRPRTDKPTIEGYELHDEVHRGGQGIVYRATQLGTRRQVALKVLLEGAFASDVARRRFEREVELAASLRHPSIVTVLDSGISQGRYYFAMEFIEGWRFDQYLRQSRPPLRQTLQLFTQVCEAVNFAHQRGVIHRDLKPSNVLVDHEGKPHLLDFGLAKSERAGDPRETTVAAVSTTGQVLGTLAYMSPEQAAGAIDVDVRSDVYALGVIFYEGLLGTTPYPIDGPLGEILNRIAKDDPTPPRQLRDRSRFGKTVDDELETILLKTLEKEPARRYQTAGDLGGDLQRYLAGEPIEAKRASGLYMLRKTLKRYRLQAAAAGVVLAMLIFFMGVFAFLYRSESQARATQERLKGEAAAAAVEAQKAADAASAAEKREAEQREKAELNAARAMRAAAELKTSLIGQKLQRADIANLRGNLAEARSNYWEAYRLDPKNPAALWGLRDYYVGSNDLGATQLALRRYGPTALSPSGAIAAVVDSPHGISLRDVESGLTHRFLPTPGPVLAIDADDRGAVAAVGIDWSALWPADPGAPCVVARADARLTPLSVHVAADGLSWILLEPDRVRRFRTAEQLDFHVRLESGAVAAAAYSRELGLLAIPTNAGVELLPTAMGAAAKPELLWRREDESRPRAVRFIDDELLGVLGDGLFVVFAAGEQRGTSLAILPDASAYSQFDMKRGVGVIALGAADGRVALHHGQTRTDAWQIAQGRVDLLRLTPDGQTLLTLDERGALTRWRRGDRQASHRRIHAAPIQQWTASADGSTLLMAGAGGEIHYYDARRGGTANAIPLPSLLGMVGGRPDAVSLSLSYDGSEAVIRTDDRIWLKSRDRARAVGARWTSSEASGLLDVQLAGGGALLAVLAQTPAGDRQEISFHRPTRGRQAGATGRLALAPIGAVTEFVGSTVRAMIFMPRDDVLIAARSDGAIVLVEPGDSPASAKPMRRLAPAADESWAALDAPAYRLAVDRAGRMLAAACDDGSIRVIAYHDTSELALLPIHERVASMAFSADGEVLMICAEDGAINLYDIHSAERIARWVMPDGTPASLAAWLGDDAAIAVAGPAGVTELQYRSADDRIADGAAHAGMREVARLMAANDEADAWTATGELFGENTDLAREARVAILDALLRRPRLSIEPAWIDAATKSASPQQLLRLGHAAAAGGRFEAARRWLSSSGDPDTRTALRIAECEYLLGSPARAVEMFLRLRGDGSLSRLEQSRAAVAYIASLVLAGRLADADAELRALQLQSAKAPASDSASWLAASVVATVMVNPDDDKIAAALRLLLTLLPQQSATYRDDIEFFAAEASRIRGQTQAAREHYQRCIDTARDDWPIDWARLRLRQIGESAAQSP